MKKKCQILILLLVGVASQKVYGQLFINNYKLGYERNQTQKWAEAVVFLENALKINPTDNKSVASRTGRPSEYFANRELGIAYLMLGKTDEAKRYLEKSYNDEPSERAKEFLLKIDPNWQDPRLLAAAPKLPQPVFDKTQLEKSTDVLIGGQSLTLKIPIRNEGEGRFEGGLIRLIPQGVLAKGVLFEPTVALRDVRAGATQIAQITFNASRTLTDGKASFLLQLESQSGKVWEEMPVSFRTQAPPAPLIRADLLTANNAKVNLERGRRARALKLVLKNEGTGALAKPKITLLFNGQPLPFNTPNLNHILAAENATLPIELYVPPSFEADAATLNLQIHEGGGEYSYSQQFQIPVYEPSTPLVYLDKQSVRWQATREGYATLLSQPACSFNVVNESEEPAKDLMIKIVQTTANAGFLVPPSQKITLLKANESLNNFLKLAVNSKQLKGEKGRFTIRLENLQGKLLDRMEVEIPILLPPKQTAEPPTAAESNTLIQTIFDKLDNCFVARISGMGDQFDGLETKKNMQASLLKECLTKGEKVAVYNDIVPEDLLQRSKFNEYMEAETYLNNLLLWYDSYEVDFQLDKARFSPIQFTEKGLPFLDVYVQKFFKGTSKSKDFPNVQVVRQQWLQIKYVFQRKKAKDGSWSSEGVLIKGVEKAAPESLKNSFTREEWEKRESAEKNEMMSFSILFAPLIDNLKAKLPSTAKRLIGEPPMIKNGTYDHPEAHRLHQQLITHLPAKKLRWVNVQDWDPAKAVPGEDFLIEITQEKVGNDTKLWVILRNFLTFETIAEFNTSLNLSSLQASTD